MRIIPAIDVIDGKCVRLTQGDYAKKKVYNENPLEVAKMFEDAGIIDLHLVDLDGAKAGKVVNWKVAESICSNTKLNVDFGGGIKKKEEITTLLNIGIRQVNLGSIAVKDPEQVFSWLDEFTSEKIILSADVKNETIAISGWLESGKVELFDFINQYVAKGIKHVACTDISVDGMLTGPNLSLYKKLQKSFPNLRIIASGGVGTMEHLLQLRAANVFGVIIGKAIYEGRITMKELIKF
ncbi:MAG TPA: 1-(5-phosphoribosyl)-5-[(5-phosphoribosylamino)methylideneamino]imidazole-4-carboxamide isomerase [Cyclobacteriaceae bacterium]|nr:1-(5-phosphoribosyl)-5-[(5-phosphoribosylamino)methylideneamino]imidazole-4-carboxamide isomerase [Cyclobacteriaceae bacterium]